MVTRVHPALPSILTVRCSQTREPCHPIRGTVGGGSEFRDSRIPRGESAEGRSRVSAKQRKYLGDDLAGEHRHDPPEHGDDRCAEGEGACDLSPRYGVAGDEFRLVTAAFAGTYVQDDRRAVRSH